MMSAEILLCLPEERYLYDLGLLDSKVIKILYRENKIYQYVQNNMAPLPAQNSIVLRTPRTNSSKNLYSLLLSSMDYYRAPEVGVRINAPILVSDY